MSLPRLKLSCLKSCVRQETCGAVATPLRTFGEHRAVHGEVKTIYREAGKGYSLTLERPPQSLTTPATLAEAKVAVTQP